MTINKVNIRSKDSIFISDWLIKNGHKAFRQKQIEDWLWKKNAHSFEEMLNIGKGLINDLNKNFYIDRIQLSDKQISNDSTVKCAYSVGETQVVEGVLIPTNKRSTACISSQVGCGLACKFCATGKLKMLRNLSPGEIVDQVVSLNEISLKNLNRPISNIVYMGMGEPLLNYKNVLRSTEILCSEKGLGMSPKRITVSTAGIAKMITKLGDDEVKFNLALSLHAANDKKRSEIMDINSSNNLNDLKDSLKHFYNKTGTRVTFEYIIFDQFNDNPEDAYELASFAKCVPCKINIIEYNPIDGEDFKQAEIEKVNDFAAILESKNLVVNIRRSRGKDIDAACGQLANKNKSATNRENQMKRKRV
ncbi:MAG: 23S rRNA (adenine(2503)-C(2))-methyltransferase RlmN [Crocinitomicaceae bacterium]|nr:23S rRNA (adenine(2503)-C(2))-methyltransferase RlmN [Crocinitomicaceae bacterium]